MSLPPSFSYFVNRLAGAVDRNTVKITPRNSSTVSMNSQIDFDLPSNSILDLTGATLHADFIFKNAVGGTNGVRAVVQTHTLFRSVMWALNNQVVSGNNSGQQWGRMYEILRRCAGSLEGAYSNCDEYRNVPICDDEGKIQGSFAASNSTSQMITFSDWCGIAHSRNAKNWDSSIFGNTRLSIQLAGTEVCFGYADSGTNNYDWELQNVELTIPVITFLGADSLYDNIMGELLNSGQELMVAYPEWYASLQSSSSTSIKFNVSSSSVDMVGWAALPVEALNATQLTSSAGAVASAQRTYGPYNVMFKAQTSANAIPNVNDKTMYYYWQINGRQYPAYGRALVSQGAATVKDAFAPAYDLNARNLLFCGIYNEDEAVPNSTGLYSFTRRNYLANNCIAVERLALDGPAHQTGMLSGLNTQGQSSVMSLNTNGFSTEDHFITFALTSAVVSAGLGQSISITY